MKSFLFAVVVGGAVWLLFLLAQSDKSLVVAPVVHEKISTVAAAVLPITPSALPSNTAPSFSSLFKGELVGVDKEKEGVAPKDDRVLVTRVVDGDTVEIEGGEKVRYIGMNTPESVDPRRAVQCFGKEASAHNKKFVEGKRVRLEPDVEDRDKYHRLLRYVWLGDTMINEQLVTDGYAQVMTIPPNVKYVERFKQAQIEAREAKRGLWSACPHRR